VKMHEGRVTVSSAGAGKGAEFTVYLPKLQRPDKGKDAERRPAARSGRAECPREVLVVEDDPDGGASLKALLEAEGHKVSVCEDGHSGLLRARETKPDVIILDIALPDSSGYEIARLLRSDPSFSHTLIVALTGYGSVEDRCRATEAGFDHHLTKPIEFAALRSLLRQQRNAGTPGRMPADAVRASGRG
jgi:DNA-binding response OmpR family regulator